LVRDLVKSAYVRLWVLPKIHRTYTTLSLAETFQNIYRAKGWGDNGMAFCSGSGSRGQISQQYCAFIVKFIREHQIQSMVDLGCGDFAIGKQIVEASSVRYTGIDVVPELIEHHKNTVHDTRVSFRCADITNDPLPAADLCLVRQVLQHLSNDEVKKVLANLRNFPRVLISEHVPSRPKSFNRDKPHGPDVRFYHRSGLYVERPPFSCAVRETWELPLTGDSILRTALLDQAGL